MSSGVNAQIVVVTVLALGLAFILQFRPRKASNLPPGPTPGWFVGNRNQVPKEGKPWRWFKELNDKYGDVGQLSYSS
jgi:hypothetical protein